MGSPLSYPDGGQAWGSRGSQAHRKGEVGKRAGPQAPMTAAHLCLRALGQRKCQSFCASHRDLLTPESQAFEITALIPAHDPDLTNILLDPTLWVSLWGSQSALAPNLEVLPVV